MAYGLPICACCGSPVGVEEHHLFLRSQGCPDDLTVYLCHACHGKAHGMRRRINVRQATTDALAHKKAQGQVYSGLPLGYAAQDGKLVPIEAELQLVAEIRDMRGQGKTLREIADDLNGRGIVGKRGGKYHASTIKAVLANSLHIGGRF